MRRIAIPALAPLLALAACSGEPATTPPAAQAKPAAPSAAPAKPAPESAKPTMNADMDAAIKELMAKPEQPVDEIVIQHILISFQGAPKMRGVTRTKEEAKVLAEKVYAEIVAGGDFDALLKQYTNDSAPGIYPLNQTTRRDMVKSFGDVGWRLKVGEIGVAPWDATASPFGWHIIKRLK
jgi:parvulin-like peptidyl-prolyl isomerase